MTDKIKIPTHDPAKHGPLDGTFGYNDYMLYNACRGKGEDKICRVKSRDGAKNLMAWRPSFVNTDPSKADVLEYIERGYNKGSQVFKYSYVVKKGPYQGQTRTGYIIRKSILHNHCQGNTSGFRYNPGLTRAEADAISYVSGTAYNSEWCAAPVNKKEYKKKGPRPYKTPWNLGSVQGLVQLLKALKDTRSRLGDSTQKKLGRQVLKGLSKARFTRMIKDVEKRLEILKKQQRSLLGDGHGTLVWVGVVFLAVHILGHHYTKWDTRREARKAEKKNNKNNDNDNPPMSPSGGGGKVLYAPNGQVASRLERRITEPNLAGIPAAVPLVDSQGNVVAYATSAGHNRLENVRNVPGTFLSNAATLENGAILYLSPQYANLSSRKYSDLSNLAIMAGLDQVKPRATRILLDMRGQVLGYVPANANNPVNVPDGALQNEAYLPNGQVIYLSPHYEALRFQQFAGMSDLYASAGISLASAEPVPEGATQPRVPRDAADSRSANDIPARGHLPGLYDGMAGAAGEPVPDVEEPFSIGVGYPQRFRPEDFQGVPDFGEQWAFGGVPVAGLRRTGAVQRVPFAQSLAQRMMSYQQKYPAAQMSYDTGSSQTPADTLMSGGQSVWDPNGYSMSYSPLGSSSVVVAPPIMIAPPAFVPAPAPAPVTVVP